MRTFSTFHRRTTYCWKSCGFYDLKQITKTENFSPTGIAYTIRIYLWIIQQTQPHLFANVRKHNSKRIFALWRFEQILRRWIKLFTADVFTLKEYLQILQLSLGRVSDIMFRRTSLDVFVSMPRKAPFQARVIVTVRSNLRLSKREMKSISNGYVCISGKAVRRD